MGLGVTIKGDFGDDRTVLCLNSGDRDVAAYTVRTHGTVHLQRWILVYVNYITKCHLKENPEWRLEVFEFIPIRSDSLKCCFWNFSKACCLDTMCLGVNWVRWDAGGGTGRGSTWPAGGETPLGAPVPLCGKLCLMSSGGGGAGQRAHIWHYRTWEGYLGSGWRFVL